MRSKLDENMPRLARERLELRGWDVHDVYDEGLSAELDQSIQQACERERRILATLWIVEPERLRIRDHATGAG